MNEIGTKEEQRQNENKYNGLKLLFSFATKERVSSKQINLSRMATITSPFPTKNKRNQKKVVLKIKGNLK